MTEKENLMKMLKGDMPEWLPIDSLMYKHEGMTPCITHVRSKAYARSDGKPGDLFGVPFSATDSTGGFALPTPNAFILKDIHDWPEVIKVPNLDDYDFEAMARKDMEGIDRSKTMVELGSHTGYFQYLMAFMGFTEGLMAMFTDPDEVKAMLAYISDFTEEVNRKCFHYYEPDQVSIVDDTATWKNPFFSVQMYRDLIKPFHAQQAKIGTELGLKVDMHNCGRCEDFIDDWMEMGVVSWNPAQTSNDLLGIKKKYGNRLILTGCWDARGELADPDVTEETVKASVRRTIETFAPGGGYMFQGSYLGEIGDEATAKKNRWIAEAYEEFGRPFYQTH